VNVSIFSVTVTALPPVSKLLFYLVYIAVLACLKNNELEQNKAKLWNNT